MAKKRNTDLKMVGLWMTPEAWTELDQLSDKYSINKSEIIRILLRLTYQNKSDMGRAIVKEITSEMLNHINNMDKE
jgi:hypothetical protein